MPDCSISLLVDEVTEESFVGNRKKELCYVDNLIVAKIDRQLTAQQRSRILKTSARDYLKGDFIFIDTDTIVTRPFPSNIFSDIPSSISACYDSHSLFKDNPYREMCISDGNKLEWPIESEDYYFNSGVLFVKDDDVARTFYKKWNLTWLEGKGKGVFMDQPAFAKTNYLMGHVVGRLDDKWNCEFKLGAKYFKEPYILHYLCTNSDMSSKQPFLLNEYGVLSAIKGTGEIPENVKSVVSDFYNGIADNSLLLAGDDMTFSLSEIYAFAKKHKRIMNYILLLSHSFSHIKNILKK